MFLRSAKPRIFPGTLLLLCFLAAAGISAQPAEGYTYGYISIENDTYSLELIDPEQPNLPIESSVIPQPADTVLSYVQASPDGNWIALTWSGMTGHRIQLLDLNTGQIRDVAWLIFFEDPYFYRYQPVWSPNSQYIAFTGTLSGAINYQIKSTYVYSIASGQLAHIKDGVEGYPTITPYQQFWSPDSSQLLVVNNSCMNAACDQRLEVFNVPSATLATEIGIHLRGGLEYICPLAWSPDGQYIHFRQYCKDLTIEYFSEVFVWDILQNSISQLTFYTNSSDSAVPIPPDAVHITDYSAYWHDADTMFFGFVAADQEYGLGALAAGAAFGTDIYTLPGLNASALMPQVGFDWTRNPITNELAYRSVTYTTGSNGELAIQNEVIQHAAFDGQTLQPIATSPAGCDLTWSPDGTYLATTNRIITPVGCALRVDGLYFLSQANHQVTEVTFDADTWVMPVGWVTMGSAAWPPPTHRIFLTNTPLPTPAITPTVIAYAG